MEEQPLKNFKRILALALIALMTLSLAACGKSDAEKLIGKWNFDLNGINTMLGIPEDQLAEAKAMPGDIGYMVFTKDGKFAMIMTAMGSALTGRPRTRESAYTVEGNKLSIDSSMFEFKIEKKTLSLTDIAQGITLTLTKAK